MAKVILMEALRTGVTYHQLIAPADNAPLYCFLNTDILNHQTCDAIK